MSQNVTEEEAIPLDRVAEVSRGQIRLRSRRGFRGAERATIAGRWGGVLWPA